MRHLIPPGKSLQFYSTLTWIVIGVFTFICSTLVFLGLAFIDYQNANALLGRELTEKSQIFAKRISAEMLLGPRGAVKVVSINLKKDLNLPHADITTQTPACFKDRQQFCIESSSKKISVYYKVPFIKDSQFVLLSSARPRFRNFIQPENLIWSVFPIVLIMALGILLQRYVLRRFFILPIQALVDTSTGDKNPPRYWPREIAEISDKLFKSFKLRDEIVFFQITRGVIHDLRTLIHTPLGAVKLVSEQVMGSDKRLSRLEHLYEVSAQQLPKMANILDNILDGSREITIRREMRSVESAISGAIETLSPFIEKSGVILEVRNSGNNVLVPHDSVQLERVLTNLIKNSIEATQETKKLREHTAVIISTNQDNSHFIIEVEDCGSGLQTTDPKRFFRTLKSTKPHGSGLGLIISKKIIEAHGGLFIPGDSSSLGGAKFSIKLPLKEVQPC